MGVDLSNTSEILESIAVAFSRVVRRLPWPLCVKFSMGHNSVKSGWTRRFLSSNWRKSKWNYWYILVNYIVHSFFTSMDSQSRVLRTTVTELKLEKVQNKEQSCRVCSCASTRGGALHPPNCDFSSDFLLIGNFFVPFVPSLCAAVLAPGEVHCTHQIVIFFFL